MNDVNCNCIPLDISTVPETGIIVFSIQCSCDECRCLFDERLYLFMQTSESGASKTVHMFP